MIQRSAGTGAIIGVITWTMAARAAAYDRMVLGFGVTLAGDPGLGFGFFDVILGAGIGAVVGIVGGAVISTMSGPPFVKLLAWAGVGLFLGFWGGLVTMFVGAILGVLIGSWVEEVNLVELNKAFLVVIAFSLVVFLGLWLLNYTDQMWRQHRSAQRATATSQAAQATATTRAAQATAIAQVLIRSFNPGHGNLSSVSYSPDSSRLVTTGADRVIKIWQITTGEEITALQGHRTIVSDARYSPDGLKLATVESGGLVKIWDVQTGQELSTWSGLGQGKHKLVYSPDGQKIATGSGHAAIIWDVNTGEQLITINHQGNIGALAYSPDGRHLVTVTGALNVWDAVTGQEVAKFVGTSPFEKKVVSVAYPSDGHHLVSGSQRGLVTIWDTDSWESQLTFKAHEGILTSIAYSPNGHYIATGSNEKVSKIWDAATGQEVVTLPLGVRRIQFVIYSPDGRSLVTGDPNSVTIWDAIVLQNGGN